MDVQVGDTLKYHNKDFPDLILDELKEGQPLPDSCAGWELYERIRSVPIEPRCEICDGIPCFKGTTLCKEHYYSWNEDLFRSFKDFIAAERAKLHGCDWHKGWEGWSALPIDTEGSKWESKWCDNCQKGYCKKPEAKPIKVGDEVECMCCKQHGDTCKGIVAGGNSCRLEIPEPHGNSCHWCGGSGRLFIHADRPFDWLDCPICSGGKS